MKATSTVLKIVAIAMAAAAAACAVVVFWDKIVAGAGAVANKVRSRGMYADDCCIDDGDEDYTDWDE